MKTKPVLVKIWAIDAGDIPPELEDACLELDDEFPLHYSTGIVQIWGDRMDNPFVKWLIVQGWEPPGQDRVGSIAVWGT